MFTFEDLKIGSRAIQTLLRNVENDKLIITLKGASEEMRQLFLDNMSQRAAKIMQEDISAMGPVRLRDEDSQMAMVTSAKDLAARGEIIISDGGSDDELVY